MNNFFYINLLMHHGLALVNPPSQYAVAGTIRTNVAGTGASTQQVYANGIVNNVNLRGPRDLTSGTTASVIGSSNDGTNYPMIGTISEIVILSGAPGQLINPLEAQKINSYLAFKYGITLAAGDYLASDGTTIYWSKGGGFDKDIFGIGVDDNGGIRQLQATSRSNNSLSIYLNDLTAMNSQDTGTQSLMDK